MAQLQEVAGENLLFDESERLKQELLDGLVAENKYINPKFFYDEYGSQLFEKIMQLPEYYPTRTELSLLENNKEAIAESIGEEIILIEPGAGNCQKVQTILPALKPSCYIPIDISADFLFECANKLQEKFPYIDIHAVADDMKAKVSVPDKFKDNERVVFYPGSTIGNYKPAEALEFLIHAKDVAGDDGGLLIGVDLQKDKETLDAAYNDEQGVTAEFNLNVINHVNRLLDSEIDVDLFKHVAFYNEEQCRIEMHLESRSDHHYVIDNEEKVSFSESERIHTEYSYKYTIDSFSKMAKKAGLKLKKFWVDDNELFSIQYYEAA